MSDFKKGDLVQVKSGGPKMTVTSVGDHWGSQSVWTVWFDGPTKKEDVFAIEAVKAVEG